MVNSKSILTHQGYTSWERYDEKDLILYPHGDKLTINAQNNLKSCVLKVKSPVSSKHPVLHIFGKSLLNLSYNLLKSLTYWSYNRYLE